MYIQPDALRIINQYRSDDAAALLRLIDKELQPVIGVHVTEDFIIWLVDMFRTLWNWNKPETQQRRQAEAAITENKRAHRYLRELRAVLCRPRTGFCKQMERIDQLSYEENIVIIARYVAENKSYGRVSCFLVATYILACGPLDFCGCSSPNKAVQVSS